MIATLLAVLVAAVCGVDPLDTLTVDPVELVQGREVPGREDLVADHYLYRYQFANEANRVAFLSRPQQFEIQFGGGCGRMGPLSGLGDAKRYAVHDGKIYIFASDSCRKTFLSDPAALMPQPDPAPQATTAALRRGRALIDQVVAACGGGARIDALNSYRETRISHSTQEGQPLVNRQVITFAYPNRLRIDQAWNDRIWSTALTTTSGWFSGPDGVREMHPQQSDVLRRERYSRNVIAILQARTRPDFVAVADPPTTGPVSPVTVAFDGATTVIGINRATGRIDSLSYRARGSGMKYGTVVKRPHDYVMLDGVSLPTGWTRTFNGETVDTSGDPLPHIEINVAVTDEHFRKPMN